MAFLRTPNNVKGVQWLVRKVLPRLRRERPDVLMGIVGSYPDPDLRAELASNSAVVTHYDVPDVTPYQFGAGVLVNPVSSGSGVQLKAVDMLMTDVPIVTRSQGTRGLPSSCLSEFDVEDDEEAFATAILRRLDSPGVDLGSRARARRPFTVEAIADALQHLQLER